MPRSKKVKAGKHGAPRVTKELKQKLEMQEREKARTMFVRTFADYASFSSDPTGSKEPDVAEVLYSYDTENNQAKFRFRVQGVTEEITISYGTQDIGKLDEGAVKNMREKAFKDSDPGKDFIDTIRGEFAGELLNHHQNIINKMPRINMPIMSIEKTTKGGLKDSKFQDDINEFTSKIALARKDWREGVWDRLKTGERKKLSDAFKKEFSEESRKEFLEQVIIVPGYRVVTKENKQKEEKIGHVVEDLHNARMLKLEDAPKALKEEIDKLKKLDTGTTITALRDTIEDLEEAHKAIKEWVEFAQEPMMWYERGFEWTMNNGLNLIATGIGLGAMGTGLYYAGLAIGGAVAGAGIGAGIVAAGPWIGIGLAAAAGAAIVGYCLYKIAQALLPEKWQENTVKFFNSVGGGIKDAAVYVGTSIRDAAVDFGKAVYHQTQHVMFGLDMYVPGSLGKDKFLIEGKDGELSDENAATVEELKETLVEVRDLLDIADVLLPNLFNGEPPTNASSEFAGQLLKQLGDKSPPVYPEGTPEFMALQASQIEDTEDNPLTLEGAQAYQKALYEYRDRLNGAYNKIERQLIEHSPEMSRTTFDKLMSLRNQLSDKLYDVEKHVIPQANKRVSRLTWAGRSEKLTEGFKSIKKSYQQSKMTENFMKKAKEFGVSAGELAGRVFGKAKEEGVCISYSDAERIQQLAMEHNERAKEMAPEYQINLEAMDRAMKGFANSLTDDPKPEDKLTPEQSAAFHDASKQIAEQGDAVSRYVMAELEQEQLAEQEKLAKEQEKPPVVRVHQADGTDKVMPVTELIERDKAEKVQPQVVEEQQQQEQGLGAGLWNAAAGAVNKAAEIWNTWGDIQDELMGIEDKRSNDDNPSPQ